MSKWLFIPIMAVSLLLPASDASAALVARWTFNNSPNDDVGALHWTLNGGATYSTDRKEGSHSLLCDGVNDYAGLPNSGFMISAFTARTIMLWFKPNTTTGTQVIYDEGGANQGAGIQLNNGMLEAAVRASNVSATLSTPLSGTNWSHVAITFDAGPLKLYLNGVEVGSMTASFAAVPNHSNAAGLGVRNGGGVFGGTATGDYYGGLIDDVRLYDHALSPMEIMEAMGSRRTSAQDPVPTGGDTDVPRDTVLAWEPGAYARTHDIYLGTVFADVNTAGRTDAKGTLASQGQTATDYQPPAPLEYGQTYFWRIDEVNGAPDHTIFKGEVWSFTVEPYGYPLTNVTATASSSQPNMGPENTVNRSGLNAADEHSTDEKQMWLSAGVQPTWIQYEFDQVYKLHELWVWNSNQLIESFLGFGAKDVKVECSTDGSTWTQLPGVPEFARAPGLPTYIANTAVSFGGVSAKHVKLTIEKGWGSLPQSGLSEVRFLYVPVQAREPVPAADATGIELDPTLSWRPGREAASHNVFFGTDQAAVAGGTAPAKSLTDRRFVPPTLELGTTYFWKVDEVGETGTYTGDVWSFITKEFAVVDDFESYTDKAGAEIFSAWIDGFDNPTRNGAIVGLDTAVGGTFGDTTTFHGGKQSMPFFYDNTTAPLSEAVLTFDAPQSWTANGIKSLSLWFQGVAGNGGQLYVKINSTKVLYDGDAADLARATWQVWNLDLSKAGNVNTVRSLTIGIEGAGAKGLLYLDDIRLYPKVPEYITPVVPDTAGLQAQYLFDGNANDSSGKGRHGTVQGGATYAAGKAGQALSFDGVDDYVAVDNYTGVLGGNPFTITAWVNSTATEDRTLVNWGASVNGQRADFRLFQGRLRMEHGNGNLQANTKLADGEWHHVACVVGPDAAIQQPDTVLYLDGKNDSQTMLDPDRFDIVANVPVTIGQRRTHNDRAFLGLLDDVRIYDRALSAAEVAGLAGQTKPIHVPF